MLTIDPKYLDVSFPAQPGGFGMGNLGRNTSQLFAAPLLSDKMDLIPATDWPELCAALESGGGLEWNVTRVFNQGQEGSCVANASAQAHQVIQAVQYGKSAVIQLSAISLYKRIGRSPSSGAMIDDGLEELRGRGVLPLDNDANKAKFKHTFPATGFHTRYPDSWEDTAKLFRGDEWYEIRSLAELVTAQLKGFPVVVGRDGHSICYLRPFYRNNRLYNLYVNSWGSWGQGAGDFQRGFGVDSYALMKSSSYWAFALRSAVVPPLGS